MSYASGKDILILPNGATYHLGVKVGELAPRIICVGSLRRARAIVKLLDKIDHEIESERLMYTFTGSFKGLPVSVVAIGMGAPMMDFFVREASYVCPEPMAIIRIGTCGLFNPTLVPGTVVCAGKGCCYTYINHGAFTEGLLNGEKCTPPNLYLTTKPVQGDSDLNDSLMTELKKLKVPVINGLNNAGETFYAAQGRQDPHFDNGDNFNITEELLNNGIDSCEMESFTLFQLAKQRTIAPVKVAAVHVGILNRVNPAMSENITVDTLASREVSCAMAALEALINVKL